MKLAKLTLKPDIRHTQAADDHAGKFVLDTEGQVGMFVGFGGGTGRGFSYCQLTGSAAGKIKSFRGIPFDNPPELAVIGIDDILFEVHDPRPMFEESASEGSLILSPDGTLLVTSLFEQGNKTQGINLMSGDVKALWRRMSVGVEKWTLLGYRDGKLALQLEQE